MTQAEALAILESGQSALLTGAAGSGKTHVLNQFIRRMRSRGQRVAVTATTGLAATHLNGTTIHAWSGIGVRDELPPYFAQGLSKQRRDSITAANILVIDEISMLHDFRLDMIDRLLQLVRDNVEPFGGLQVVCCGDFFQLPPVNRADGPGGGFVTEAKVWQVADWAVCYLHEQHRQTADAEFTALLSAIRLGQVPSEMLGRLQQRIGADFPDNRPSTRLHTTNADVDAINTRQLENLPGQAKTYRMTTSGKKHYVEQLSRSCLAPAELQLKKSALVMCIKNSPDRKYANGSLGTVVDFEPDSDWPIVRLTDGRTTTIKPEAWELVDGDKRQAMLSQLPLRLAWAITIHKSQGMTLDAAQIDLSRAFVEGMGYVALSRVRNLESLVLHGFNAMALRVSPQALAIDHQLQERSSQAAERFDAVISAAASERLQQLEPEIANQLADKPTSAWSERLDKMRQTYPNAYRPWTKTDDQKLKSLFESGAALARLSTDFGRHPGSIRARLQKHYGDNLSFGDQPNTRQS